MSLDISTTEGANAFVRMVDEARLEGESLIMSDEALRFAVADARNNPRRITVMPYETFEALMKEAISYGDEDAADMLAISRTERAARPNKDFIAIQGRSDVLRFAALMWFVLKERRRQGCRT